MSRRDAQAADLQARLQEELLAQKAGLEAQQAAMQAQLDREREVVRGLDSSRGDEASTSARPASMLPPESSMATVQHSHPHMRQSGQLQACYMVLQA